MLYAVNVPSPYGEDREGNGIAPHSWIHPSRGILSVSDTKDISLEKISSSLSRDLFNHRHDATSDSGWGKRPHVDQLSKLGVADCGGNGTCAAFCAT